MLSNRNKGKQQNTETTQPQKRHSQKKDDASGKLAAVACPPGTNRQDNHIWKFCFEPNELLKIMTTCTFFTFFKPHVCA